LTKAELLALTPADFNFDKETVTINKSYQRLKGQDVITSPKTKKSNRTIKMPKFLCEEMKEYLGMLYGLKKKDRIFTVTKREKEVAALGAKIEQKQIEFDVLSERVLNYDKAKDELSNLEIELDTAPKYQLPEPEKFMTAKAYKTKMAEPVVRKLKQLVKTVLARCFEGWDNYHRLNTANAQLYRTNQRLEKVNERLTEENKILKAENKDYSLLRKVFGRKQIDDLLEQARTVKGRKRDNTRSR
jgi:hypothetical protein